MMEVGLGFFKSFLGIHVIAKGEETRKVDGLNLSSELHAVSWNEIFHLQTGIGYVGDKLVSDRRILVHRPFS